MKILYLPSLDLQFRPRNLIDKLRYKLYQDGLEFMLPRFGVSGELNSVGGLAALDGVEFFVIDEIHPFYFTSDPAKFNSISNCEHYPSNSGFAEPRRVHPRQVLTGEVLPELVLASIRHSKPAKQILTACQRRDIPIALLDKYDHPEVFTTEGVRLDRSTDVRYHLYLKQDLPRGAGTDVFVPLAPVPVAMSLLQRLQKMPAQEKTLTWSFVGDYRRGVTRKDRQDIIHYLQREFANHRCVMGHDKRSVDGLSQDQLFSSSMFNVSPGGKVWDSYRHTALSGYGTPIVMPRPDIESLGQLPCEETALLYDTRVVNGDVEAVLDDRFNDAINNLIDSPRDRTMMATSWFEVVKKEHTHEARAKQLLERFKLLLK